MPRPTWRRSRSTAASSRRTSARSTLVVVLYLASALILWGATYVQIYMTSWVGQKVLQDLRLTLFDHLQKQSSGFYSRRKTGVLVSRLTNDVEALDQLVSNGAMTLFSIGHHAGRDDRDPAAAERAAGAGLLRSSSRSSRWPASSSASSRPTSTARRASGSASSPRTCRRRSPASPSSAPTAARSATSPSSRALARSTATPTCARCG